MTAQEKAKEQKLRKMRALTKIMRKKKAEAQADSERQAKIEADDQSFMSAGAFDFSLFVGKSHRPMSSKVRGHRLAIDSMAGCMDIKLTEILWKVNPTNLLG